MPRAPAAPPAAAAPAAATASAPAAAATANDAAEQMASMTPEQLRQQAQAMRSMDPSFLRRMNPQLAHMTDDQIKMAAVQMEMMADNPEMAKMAVEQMNAMTPEQIEAVKAGGAPPPGAMGAGGVNPSKFLEGMDRDQLRNMLSTVKDNPDMMKQFAGMSGLPEEQLRQGVETFAGMDDKRLDMALGTMKTLTKAKEAWDGADKRTGGNLKAIVIGSAILLATGIAWLLFFRGRGGEGDPLVTSVPEVPEVAIASHEEDEFGSEF